MGTDDDLFWYDDATYQQGLHYYYPHTKDIYPYAFIVSLSYCILLTLLLPCGVAIYQKTSAFRKQQETIIGGQQTSSSIQTTPIISIANETGNVIHLDSVNIAHTEETQAENENKTIFSNVTKMFPYPTSMVLPFACGLSHFSQTQEDGIVQNADPGRSQGDVNDDDEHDKDDDIVNSYLSGNDYINMDNDESGSLPSQLSSSDDDDDDDDDDDHSVVRKPSATHENITTHHDGNKIQQHYVDTKFDFFYGHNPWYCYYCSCTFWRKIKISARYDQEMEKILSLAFPFTIQIIIENVFALLEAGVIGRQLGTLNLTAYYTVDFGISFATMFLHGILSSLSVLVSHAVGAQNYRLAGLYVQLSVWTYQLIFLPMMILTWNRFGEIVAWFGFDDDIAASAQGYAQFALLNEAIGIYDTALHYVLSVTGHERYSTGINAIQSLSSFITVLCVSKFQRVTRLPTIGAIHLGFTILFSTMNVAIILYKRWFDAYWRGMIATNPFRDRGPITTFFRAAIPLSCGYVIEYCEWDILFVFAALQGPAEIAVWGLLGQLWQVADDIVMALSNASEVRVAQLLGLGRPKEAKYSSHKSIFMGVISAVIMAALLDALRMYIPKWLTNDGILQRMLRNLMPMACLGVALLSFGSMSWSILCAQGRTPIATAVTGFGSLFITIPLASISTFYFNYNLQGLAACLVIGYATSGFFNSLLMLTSNWVEISKDVRRRTKQEEQTMKDALKLSTTTEGDAVYIQQHDNVQQKYEDSDFEELSEDIKKAAIVLGYDKEHWDQGLDIKNLDVYWQDLPKDKRLAAAKLGYDEQKWNAT